MRFSDPKVDQFANKFPKAIDALDTEHRRSGGQERFEPFVARSIEEIERRLNQIADPKVIAFADANEADMPSLAIEYRQASVRREIILTFEQFLLNIIVPRYQSRGLAIS